MSEITFKVEDSEADSAAEYSLAAKYAVCGDCRGEGMHLTPSIREHAYTQEEMEEEGPEFLEEYLKRGGIYDVQCETCNGLRVVLVPDEDQCDPAILAIYNRLQDEKAREARERAYEEKMGY